jgi:hypothetical protein
MSLKNPVTPPGIHPGTFRLVAQRLNNYATPGPTLNAKYELRCLISDFSSWRPGFSPKAVTVEFVVHKVAMEEFSFDFFSFPI